MVPIANLYIGVGGHVKLCGHDVAAADFLKRYMYALRKRSRGTLDIIHVP